MDKYYYNDIIAPELPTWDRVEFPYAYINQGFITLLYVSKEPITYGPRAEVGNLHVVHVPAGHSYSRLTGDWGSFNTGQPYANISVLIREWTNHDIINTEDGSVYLAASDPVPVLEWSEHDIYKRVNGVWVKQDTHRRVNGAWVKQDEYRL